jgi:hypothetical protein
MKPFVLARPSRASFSTVPRDIVEPNCRRDLAFFAARGICIAPNADPAESTEMSTTVTSTTKRIVTIGDVDERVVEQIDDNASD